MANKVWKPEILTPHQRWKLRRFWQTHPPIRVLTYITIFFLIGFMVGKCTTNPEIQEIIKEKQVEKIVEVDKGIFTLEALNPHLVGYYGDNIQWSGSNIRKYNGSASLRVDSKNKIGLLTVEFDGSVNPEEDALFDGLIKIVMTEFSGEEDWKQEGIANDVLLFGDTGRGFGYLPKTKAEVAGWGKANLYLDGQIVLENLEAMFMYSDGIRKPDGKIAKSNGELYSLTQRDSVEFFDANEKELHFMVYSDDYAKSNFPQNSIFINMYFEEIKS